ncbi:hypothetical protein EOPP23_13915 [Endozoicomonas sp. OPT23]|uniref:SDR family NAD(P)-dependent oxidoreductase n=1 Tax=Endozoicomonas sp. OPT23 TaxID=2072845 RepID=UPI00129B8B66|nr:SDR family NAD(P)-dependent oxidoreductase [Endozoicomonas sp. OPT23]MRI34087.1 hypothetical protein [Endozoicomonas sp. OPT23]
MKRTIVSILLLLLSPCLLAQPKVVLVTGASKGIGKALVNLLAEYPEQYRVYGTYRTSMLADEKMIERIPMLYLNHTSPESMTAAIETIRKKERRLDVLVNNAGMAVYGPLEELPDDEIRRQIEANLTGPMLLMKRALPVMRKNNYGRIINVSSLAGAFGIPMMDAYSATKFGLEGACAALEGYLGTMKQSDGQLWNLHCQVIEPGYTRTEIKKSAWLADDKNLPDHFHTEWLGFRKALEKGLKKGQPALEVAEVIKRMIDDESSWKQFRMQTRPDRKEYIKEKYGLEFDATGKSMVLRPAVTDMKANDIKAKEVKANQ